MRIMPPTARMPARRGNTITCNLQDGQSPQVSVRHAKIADIPAAARLFAQVFEDDDSQTPFLPQRRVGPGEWEAHLRNAFSEKLVAARTERHLTSRFGASHAALQEHAVARGRPWPTSTPALSARQRQRLRRARHYSCLMAEERAGGDLVGAVTLHLAWPDAVLPAPLPPLRQLRACICNLAVAPRSRWARSV
uniref:Uncharacterized protein n=1 Tax=Auxenochlorella protothecoides TaxID=3075 RepID=A0A1D2A367_AUXPR